MTCIEFANLTADDQRPDDLELQAIPTVSAVDMCGKGCAYVEIIYEGLYWTLFMEWSGWGWGMLEAEYRRHALAKRRTRSDPPDWMIDLAISVLEDP